LDSKKPGRHTLKNHAPYAALLLGALGFIANVAGVAGLVLDHANDLVVFMSVLAIICGLYLLLKRWGKPVNSIALLSVALMISGSVVLTLALAHRATSGRQQQSHDNHTTTTTTNDPGKTATPISAPDVSAGHTVVFQTSVKLLAQEGLDIDGQKASVLEQQSTANAPSDIYLSDYPSLIVTIDNFYKYQPPAQSTGNADKDQYNSCQSIIAHSQLGDHIIVPIATKPGQQYCLTTTAGKLALMTLQELDDGGKDPSQYSASISVKVWD
jgi:hypothetical protein